MASNNSYRSQLYAALDCTSLDLNQFNSLPYKYSVLKQLFTDYNKCAGGAYKIYEDVKQRDLFNLNIRPGLSFNSFHTSNSWNYANIDFGSSITFRLGIETEFILPFNNNKWAIILEPTLQYFKSEQSETIFGNAEIEFSTIELPLGLRHYFFLNEKSKIFINAQVLHELPVFGDHFIHWTESKRENIKLETTFNLALGAGYNFQDKFSAEIRYYTNKSLLGSYLYWDSTFKCTSIVIGYNLF